MLTALAIATAVVAGASCSSDDPAPAAQSEESYCSLLLAFRSLNDLNDELASADAKALATSMDRLVGQGELLQRAAPEDIKSDTDTVAAYIKALDGLLAKYGYDVDKLQADPKGVDEYTTITNDEVDAALDQVQSYGDVECAAAGSSAPTSTG